jgi:hypothetical protein
LEVASLLLMVVRRRSFSPLQLGWRQGRVAAASWRNTAAAGARVIGRHVKRVVIANPIQVRLIAHAKIKTDTIGASVLAQLYLPVGFLPEVWIPDEATRALRR